MNVLLFQKRKLFQYILYHWESLPLAFVSVAMVMKNSVSISVALGHLFFDTSLC